MAHGSPRYEICVKCKRYTLVARFNVKTNCDKCNKRLTQTCKLELIDKYGAPFFNFEVPNLYQFIQLK